MDSGTEGIEFDHLEAATPVPGLEGWTISFEVRADTTQRPYVSGVTLRSTGAGPTKPLTTAAWRSLPIGRMTDEVIAKYREFAPAIWDAFPADQRIQRDAWGKPEGPRGHPDARYAALAAAYVRRIQAGSREPLSDLMATMGCPKSTANARLFTARKRGLLHGHELTPKAVALLEKIAPSATHRRT